MILQGLLFLIFSLVKFILRVIPAFPSPEISIDFTPLMMLVRLLNQFINLKVVGTLMGCYLTVVVAFWIWSFLNWLLHKIPGVS